MLLRSNKCTLSKQYFKKNYKNIKNTLELFASELKAIQITGRLGDELKTKTLKEEGLAPRSLPPVQRLNSLIEYKFRTTASSFLSIQMKAKKQKAACYIHGTQGPCRMCAMNIGAGVFTVPEFVEREMRSMMFYNIIPQVLEISQLKSF